MRSAAFALLLGATLSACASSPPALSDPSEWVREDARGLFSFLLPPSLIPQEVQGVDSYVGEYWGDGVTVGFDYGWYSTPLKDEGERGYTRRPVVVGGKEAVLVRYQTAEDGDGQTSVAGLHVPRAVASPRDADGIAAHADTRLTLWATCRTEALCDQIEAALLSVTFAE